MTDAPLEPPGAQPPPAAVEPPPDMTGRTLGDYQLLRRLGVGGMGQVYLARQLSLKRQVAVKLLRDDLAASPTALKRFEAEAQAVARLNHPNIVHIHQIGEQDGLRYMALEFVDGRNLRDHLARKGPPELPVCLSVMRQVAQALQSAHAQGIVHRDIKPENILVTRKVDVKVTDFGLSRYFAAAGQPVHLTQSGIALGTPLYMSPEQVQGKATDHRSDIYSFGVTCYHLLAGEPPFRGTTAFEVALRHVQEQPRPLAELRPDLPADLCGIVHKMMAKDPADRYQSAREIVRDLGKVRDGIALGLPGPAGSRGNSHPAVLTLSGSGDSGLTLPGAPAPARRARWFVAGLACLAATAGGVLVFAATHPPPEPLAPPPDPPPAVGLPPVEAPEKIVTTRERELLALLANRTSQPDEIVKGSIELGLLCIREGRLDEAEKRFQTLEKEQFKQLVTSRTAYIAGRLGQATALAYRDQPQAAARSLELFVGVVTDPPPKFGSRPEKGGYQVVAGVLLRHPDLGQAVADALNRNAVTLGKTKLDPPALELLRSPPRAGKKE